MYKQFIKNNNVQLGVRYKAYKNKLLNIIRKEKRRYYSNLLQKNKSDIQATWKIINNILKRKKNSGSVMPNEFVGQDGKQVTNMLDIVNGFNDFFVNVGPDLAKNIPCELDKTIFNYLKDRNANSIFLAPVLEQEVINITRNCKTKHPMIILVYQCKL